MSSSELDEGLGNITWWGFSPAVRLEKECNSGERSDLNVLLLGSGDGRHIFQSIAERSDQDVTPTFFVLEQNVCLYARQLLFMALLTDSDALQTDLERAEAFLEVYGNAVIRARTAMRMREIGRLLKKKTVAVQAGEGDAAAEFLPNADLAHLKSKDLDQLVEIFESWERIEEIAADDEQEAGSGGGGGESGEATVLARQYWDFRQRQLLRDRFDVRDGIFEMDYQLRLVSRGGANISYKEYGSWRKSGNAFKFRSEEEIKKAQKKERTGKLTVAEVRKECYAAKVEDDDEPVFAEYTNLTLVSGVPAKEKKTGKKFSKVGFWGDIVTGPFTTYAFSYATEVDLHTTRLARPCQERMLELSTKMAENAVATADALPKVVFLPPSHNATLVSHKSKYVGLFDVAFVGCSVTHMLVEEFVANLRHGEGIIVVETPLYLLHVSREVLAKFGDKLVEDICGESCGLEVREEYKPEETALVRCRRKIEEGQ